ncbi:MAG: SCO family protein [Alphaproteobacteria bacterium]|nr:SCO family protein [Alphaproteobacteria bacterium]
MHFQYKIVLSVIGICAAIVGSFWLSKLLTPSQYEPYNTGVAIVKERPGRGTPQIGGDFYLVDHQGHPRTDIDFRGSYMLVYFGYSFCPDICPAALSAMSEALIKLDKDADQIQPIFITVDPQRDTIENLALYVQNFHPRLIGLTGTKEQITQAQSAYRVYASKVKPEGTATEYLVDHSSIIYLMDPQGRMIAHFNHLTPSDDIVKKIKEIL